MQPKRNEQQREKTQKKQKKTIGTGKKRNQYLSSSSPHQRWQGTSLTGNKQMQQPNKQWNKNKQHGTDY